MTRALVGPGYAGGPGCVVGARVGAEVGRVVGGDVGDGEAAAGAEDPMDFGEHDRATTRQLRPLRRCPASDARPGVVQDGPQAHDADDGWLVPARVPLPGCGLDCRGFESPRSPQVSWPHGGVRRVGRHDLDRSR